MPASAAPLTGGGEFPDAEGGVRTTRSSRCQPPVFGQLVRQRQPDDQPALRQLRRSGELGRNPDADNCVSSATAQQQAGSISVRAAT